MKKVLVVIILFVLGLFILLNVMVCVNISNNKRVLNIIGDIFYKDKADVGSAYEYEYDWMMPILEIDGTSYVGVINVLEGDSLVPIQGGCDNSVLGINSGCVYGGSGESLIVVGTGFGDSFRNYDMYDVGDVLVYMNMVGDNYHYRVSLVDKVDELDEVFEYDGDMILVVKDYVDMEYVLFVCNRD